MTQGPKGPATPRAQRQARLAAALRSNLQKRKQQARKRATTEDKSDARAGDPPRKG